MSGFQWPRLLDLSDETRGGLNRHNCSCQRAASIAPNGAGAHFASLPKSSRPHPRARERARPGVREGELHNVKPGS